MPKRPTPEFLRAVAAFRGYAFPERLQAWEERFVFGLPDIEQVFETAVVGEPVLSAPRAPQVQSFEPARYHPQTTTVETWLKRRRPPRPSAMARASWITLSVPRRFAFRHSFSDNFQDSINNRMSLSPIRLIWSS